MSGKNTVNGRYVGSVGEAGGISVPDTVANQRVEDDDEQQRYSVARQDDHSEEIGAFQLFARPDLTTDENRLRRS